MLFVMLPKPEKVLAADLQIILAAFLLMKVGGQEAASMADLRMLANDYVGYTIHYSPETESFTFKLKTRSEEYPQPEKVV